MSALPNRKYLKHAVPSWVVEDGYQSCFFITVCCEQRGLNQLALDAVWTEMLESIQFRESRGELVCRLFLAMPDHIHGLFRFEGQKKMALVIRGWKRWIAQSQGVKWQRGFFDHRIRDNSSGIEKRDYILKNPVRAGLIEDQSDWKYVYNPAK